MRNTRTLLIGVVVLLFFVVTAFAQEAPTLALDLCIKNALEASPHLNASRAKAEAAYQSHRMSQANRLPSLALNGKADWISETMSLDLPSTPLFTPPQVEFGDGTNYDIALALNAPLFTGGSLRRSERAAQSESRASRLDLAADSLQLLYDVRGAYFRALAAQKAVEVAQQGRDALHRHLEELQGMIEQGMASRETLLLTEARLSDADRGLVTAETRLHSSRLALGRLVGEPGREIIPEGDLEASLLPSETGLETSLAHRPDLLALEARSESSRYRVDAAGGAFWPTVSAQAAMHYGKPGIDQITNEWMDYATVGVRLSWTLFDWGERGSRVQQARSMSSALDHSRQEMEQAWQTRLATAHVQFNAASRERDLAGERVRLYEERLALLSERYKQGMATDSERLDALDELTLAKHNHVAAEANIRLAEADLLFILGR